jgi:hypothetical protein
MRPAFYQNHEVLCPDEPLEDAVGDFIRSNKGRVKLFYVDGRAHKKKA